MTFRSFLILVLLVTLGVVGTWMWFARDGFHPATVATGKPPTPTIARGGAAPVISSVDPGAPQVRSASTGPGPAMVAIPADLPTIRPEPDPEARADLERVRFMLRDFRTRMGENPVGSNAEIMRAIMGGNSAGATLGPPVGHSLNADGELIDRWGTPYFFHQLSKDSMEIRSAGPDRRMWTADDLVTK